LQSSVTGVYITRQKFHHSPHSQNEVFITNSFSAVFIGGKVGEAAVDAAGQPRRNQGGLREHLRCSARPTPARHQPNGDRPFFRFVEEHLAAEVSVVIEAAFQHMVWEYGMPRLLELAHIRIVLCTVDTETAAQRSIQRGLEHPDREFYHGDNRVVHFKRTGKILAPADYEEPQFDVPTIKVSTDREYSAARRNSPAISINQDERLDLRGRELLFLLAI
jgi:hypothetical protein